MRSYTKTINGLIEAFRRLPGVGERTAERYVFALLRKPEDAKVIAQALTVLPSSIRHCGICFAFTETDPCPICADRRRDHATICVLAREPDMAALESSGAYHGIYHILGGVLSPIHGLGPETLTIKQLIERIEAAGGGIHEVILATNPDVEGEATASYLASLLARVPNLKITRLARGLPTGGELEYADELTLKDALAGRREIK